MIGSHPKVAKTCNRDTSLLIVLSKSCVHIQLKCGVLLFDFFSFADSYVLCCCPCRTSPSIPCELFSGVDLLAIL